MSQPATLNGSVRRIVRDRGFGFIRSGGDEYFFHHTSYDGDFQTLQENDEVTFTLGESPKGPRAENVCRSSR